MKIGVVDYRMGNLRSVLTGLKRVSASGFIVSFPEEIGNCDKLILPGVGSFGDAVRNLKKAGLDEGIREFIRRGRPFLGICLGFQLLFEESEESKGVRGLEMFKGKVVRFPEIPGIRIPHVGWNSIDIKKPSSVLEGVENGTFFYFVHSYYVVPQDRGIVLTETDYFVKFCSSILYENILGVQFHPEKSQREGLKFLYNFSFNFK